MTLMHATVVAVDGKGVLITGPSGSGKSDLALRLIDRGAVLVSDDQVDLSADENSSKLFAHTPEALAGLIEVRGVGLMKTDYVGNATVALHVDLGSGEDVERLPEPSFTEFFGVKVRKIWLNAQEDSSPLKVEWALKGNFVNID
jgi:serine kinase of HPr protein (carbohydrate metabolism regulator)